jgi:two-component system chemotaxis response regulator CheY
MRRIVINTLGQMGCHDCHEAGSGVEAIRSLVALPIGLVILQRHLPDMSGVDLARALRRKEATRDIGIVMVTKNESEDEILAARRVGVTEWVVVPLNANILKTKIATAMRGVCLAAGSALQQVASA